MLCPSFIPWPSLSPFSRCCVCCALVQRIRVGRQFVSNCSLSSQLHPFLFSHCALPGIFTLWSPNPSSWPSHLLHHRLHRSSCPQPVSEHLTTKRALHLHLLSLSDWHLQPCIIMGRRSLVLIYANLCHLCLARTSLKRLSPYHCTLYITDESHF